MPKKHESLVMCHLQRIAFHSHPLDYLSWLLVFWLWSPKKLMKAFQKFTMTIIIPRRYQSKGCYKVWRRPHKVANETWLVRLGGQGVPTQLTGQGSFQDLDTVDQLLHKLRIRLIFFYQEMKTNRLFGKKLEKTLWQRTKGSKTRFEEKITQPVTCSKSPSLKKWPDFFFTTPLLPLRCSWSNHFVAARRSSCFRDTTGQLQTTHLSNWWEEKHWVLLPGPSVHFDPFYPDLGEMVI